MIRKLEAIGLATVLALALGATFAAAAPASQFTAGEAPATVQGAQTEGIKFTFAGATTTCSSTSLDAAMTGPSAEALTINPIYTACSILGFGTTIDLNGCDYVARAGGTLDLECPPEHPTVITIGSICTITLDTQTGMSPVTYANGTSGGHGDVTMTTEVDNLIYTVHKKSLLCPLAAGTREDGVIEGMFTLTATNAKALVDFSWDS